MRLRGSPPGGSPTLSYLGRSPTGGLVGGAPYPSLPGKSAYELAVDQGYEGTLSEWIDLLQGDIRWGAVKEKPDKFPPEEHTHLSDDIDGLATVATSGSYGDLADKPEIPDPLPDQSGQSGKVLSTDGTAAEWITAPSGGGGGGGGIEFVSATPESGVPGVTYFDVVGGKIYQWED